jgi:hypothetical protein
MAAPQTKQRNRMEAKVATGRTSGHSRKGRIAGGATAGIIPTAVAALSMLGSAPTPTTAPSAPGCGPHCGTERWPLKTMSDAGAFSVILSPLQKSVHELVNTPAPTASSDTERLNEVEKQAFSVKATLVGYKIESGATGDQDFHIVIRDPSTQETMIVEIPDPECDGVCNSTQRAAITKVRQAFLDAFPDNPPSASFIIVKDPKPEVTVTGVGLYDFFHGQTGVATNCVELHPVLDIQFPAPGTFQSGANKTEMATLKTVAGDHTCIPKSR